MAAHHDRIYVYMYVSIYTYIHIHMYTYILPIHLDIPLASKAGRSCGTRANGRTPRWCSRGASSPTSRNRLVALRLRNNTKGKRITYIANPNNETVYIRICYIYIYIYIYILRSRPVAWRLRNNTKKKINLYKKIKK